MSIDRSNIDQLARDALDDFGLVFDDNTEDLVDPKAGVGHAMTERMSRPGGDDPAGAVKVAQISTPQAGMIPCARCSARGGGRRRTATPATETFTVVAAFDKHRAGSHTLDDRHCFDPAAVGLVDAGRAYPCWGFPGRGEYEGES